MSHANAIDSRIGINLKERRVQTGISCEKLAEITSIEVSHLSHIENGTARASADQLLALSVALKIDVCDIYDGIVD